MAPKQSVNLYAYVALGFGILSIGFSAIFISLADAPGIVSSFYRMAIGALLIAAPFWNQNRKKRAPLPRRGIFLAIFGGFLFGIDLALWSTGITLSGATNPTLLANTAPLWVGLGSIILFKERQNGLFWFGLSLAMLGAAAVLGADLSAATTVGLGTLFGLLAAVFYGGYYLVTQTGRRYLNTTAYFWITTTSSALFLLVLNITLNNAIFGYDQITYLIFIALGLLVQALGWMALNYAQGYLPASIVAPTMLGQPLVTAILAVFLLGERFTLLQIFGGLAVILGVYLVHRSRIKFQPAN